MSDSPGRSADRDPGGGMRFTVDVVLYDLLARTGAGRTERVVLRRTVFTELPDASEVWVEELWTSASAAHVHPLLAVVRGIGRNARRLVLGEPVAVPDLEPVTGPAIDELTALVDRVETVDGGVDRLVGFRGTVEVGDGTRRLERGELLWPSAGLLARPVRSAFRRVIADLGCTADGADPDGDPLDGAGAAAEPQEVAEPPGVADVLRTDLRDARTRDHQHTLWRSVAGAQLGPPVEVPPVERSAAPGPVFAHWPRRTADGTTLIPPDGVRPDLDAAAVIFVEVDDVEGLQIGQRNRQVNLFRYRLDARIDLQGVLRQETVRAAFAAYAASGGTDPGLREAAIDALLDAGAADETEWRRHGRRIDRLGGPSSGTVGWLGGTVVFTDCRGIQVGNHLRQYNTFTYTVAPSVHTAALLRDHPDLVESIVRYACLVDGPARRDVQRSLHDAVCGSAGEHLLREPGTGSYPLGSASSHEVGVTVGRSTVDDVVDVDLVGGLSRTVGRVVDAERRRVAAAERRRAKEHWTPDRQEPHHRVAPRSSRGRSGR